MSSWIAVSRTEHGDKHWHPRSGYGFARSRQFVPVILAELTKLIPHYVMGFLQDNDGRYQTIALLSVGGDRNLYVTEDSKWLCSYVPATMRGFPFALLDNAEQNTILCIDDEHINDDKGCPPLFTEDGKLDTQAAQTFEFITQVEQSRQQTKLACDALASVELITSWPLTINRAKGMTPIKINGLHRINEEALNKLDSESLAGLRASGALALAYAQMFSIAQMEQLAQRAEYLANAQQPPDDGRGDIFGNEDSGSLNFDAFEAASNDTDEK